MVFHFPFHYLLHGLAHSFRQSKPAACVTDRREISDVVECEKCHSVYVYQLCRAAQGQSMTGDHKTAAERARKKVTHILMTECDPVPCPVCGWYQRRMIRQAQQLKYRGFYRGSLVSLCVGANLFCVGSVIAAFLAPTTSALPSAAWCIMILACAALVVGLALPILKFILCRLFNPNNENPEDVESRKQLGLSLARIRRVGDWDRNRGNSTPATSSS
jgi:hypothetical protein